MARRLRRIGPNAAWAAAVALAFAPAAFAFGEADGEYLRLLVLGKGIRTSDADGSIVGRGSATARCYMRLVWTGVDPLVAAEYEASIACETSPGTWEQTNGPLASDGAINLQEVPGPAALGEDEYLSVGNSAGHVIEGYGAHQLLLRFDWRGNLRNARFETLGSEMIDDSTSDPGNTGLTGTYQAWGSRVAAERVPADARAVLP